MARKVASPKSTGGGGGVFEDDVCAWLLACLLTGEPVFGAGMGPLLRLDFQTRPDGWLLDDALATTSMGTVRHRFAISIKSTPQFTGTSAPADFVTCAWEHWLGIGSQVFDPKLDYLGLITSPLSAATRATVSGLLDKACVADPELFPRRLATPNWASRDERKLFASFACPAQFLKTHQAKSPDAVCLLQRLWFGEHDFGRGGAKSETEALRICRKALRSQTDEAAMNLWLRLCRLSKQLRPRAGSITLAKLIDLFRREFVLADYPDHAADWSKLHVLSHRTATQVRNSVGYQVHLERTTSVSSLRRALGQGERVVLLGESGVGKSAVARALYESRTGLGEETLWFDARSFEHTDFGTFESGLRLQHPLFELLSDSPSSDPLLILDGIDRLRSDDSFHCVATLLGRSRLEKPSTRWRILLTCQPQEWPRVLNEIERVWYAGRGWSQVVLDRLSAEELSPVGIKIPSLAKLLLQPRVADLLGNLKILDLVVRNADAGEVIDPSTWVGESSVADWFWRSEVDRGADKVARGVMVRRLAGLQADLLLSSVPADDMQAGGPGPLDTLVREGICVMTNGDRVAFGHDLYGDWVRLRDLLNNQADLRGFLQTHGGSPLWHRAIRLLGIHLLERPGGVDQWRSALTCLGNSRVPAVCDLLLEAPVFSANARPLLEAILPDLLSNQGVLLRRLLTRFLAFATAPNSELVDMAKAEGIDENQARATYREPYWPYWLDMIRFLHAHSEEVLAVAPNEVALVVELWLRFASVGAPLRSEAAHLGVMLGHRALLEQHAYGATEVERHRQRFYACCLAAAQERTDEVADIALTAARRGSPPNALPQGISPRVDAVRAVRQTALRGPRMANQAPWPDGPREAVDGCFKAAILDTWAILKLFRIRPGIAREVVLATLIEPPHEEDHGRHSLRSGDLSLVNWHPWRSPLYTHGPFLGCLLINFVEGLELIARLVEFATSRWCELGTLRARESSARALSIGAPDCIDEPLVQPDFRHDVTLEIGDTLHLFVGGSEVFGWYAGLGQAPNPVAVSLMALEQYFYIQLDQGKDVTRDIEAVLGRARSVAFLGVLCAVGKKEPALLQGPLRPLYIAPELYLWDLHTTPSYSRMFVMGGADRQGSRFFELAKAFHTLPHRHLDLRQIAYEQMLQSDEMAEFFDGLRAKWVSGRASNSPGSASPLLDQLVALLDRSNCRYREIPGHGYVWENVEMLRLSAEFDNKPDPLDDYVLVMNFAVRCRLALDEKQALSFGDLGSMWEDWKRIRLSAEQADPPEGDWNPFGNEHANAIMGGVAVMLRYVDWCARETGHTEELVEALRSALSSPPTVGGCESPDVLSTWTWDCFAAEAVAILWARNPPNSEWRCAVANMVFAPRYPVVTVLFNACAEHRTALGADFSRLRRLALEWAYTRDLWNLLWLVPPDHLGLDQDHLATMRTVLAGWVEERVAAFVSGSLKGMPVDWEECHERQRFAELDTIRARWHPSTTLDFHLVRCAHEWLPLPNNAFDDFERQGTLQFWRAALGAVLVGASATPKVGNGNHPDEDESWVISRLAVVVLQLRCDEQPGDFWQPILDLGGEAHDWPDMFLSELHQHALKLERTPESYGSLVRLMVQHAITDDGGEQRWSLLDRVWEALLGLDSYCCYLWEPRHASLVVSLADVYDLWMDRVPPEGGRLAAFATWLARPAASSVRFRSLGWFLRLLSVEPRCEIPNVERVPDALAALLNVVWDEDESRLRRDQTTFDAFFRMLRWLADRQNTVGLELLGRIGGLS